MTEQREPRPEDRPAEPAADRGSWKRSVVIIAILLLGAALVVALTLATEPTVTRGGATKETAMLVEVMPVQRGRATPTFVATGTVEAARDITLRPQVGGQVIALAPELTPGGFVEEGQLLLRIDPADYRNVLAQRRSELRRAASELQIERGRQRAAKKGYELLGEAPLEMSEDLVLREPQREAAEARVMSARAAVEQAQLDLERTRIRAPFAAHVLRRDVNVGSRVQPGDDLARLVGLETYWVVATLPLAQLRWIAIPPVTPDAGAREDAGARVSVRNRTTWPDGESRVGRISRLIGALDADTRMAQLLITISDPLARESDAPPLIVGEFVEARIRAKPLDDVIALDRDYVRDADTVWVMEDGRLRVREVEIVLRDAERAYIGEGLEDGARVVTSNLASVTDGAKLRVDERARVGTR